MKLHYSEKRITKKCMLYWRVYGRIWKGPGIAKIYCSTRWFSFDFGRLNGEWHGQFLR